MGSLLPSLRPAALGNWLCECRAMKARVLRPAEDVCSFWFCSVHKERLSLFLSLFLSPQVTMAAVDSFYLLYREIARSCNCYMEALALVGAWYTARKSITVICDFYSLIRLHFIPRLGSRPDLIKQYGRWAVISGNCSSNGFSVWLVFSVCASNRQLQNLTGVFCLLPRPHSVRSPHFREPCPQTGILHISPAWSPALLSYPCPHIFPALCFEIIL